jgi:hypothetical protein
MKPVIPCLCTGRVTNRSRPRYPEEMANAATYDDVNLIIKIYELRRDPKLREARDWFNSQFRPVGLQEFMEKYPMGSEANAYFRMVTSYWDMVASFITCGVLNQELFFQSGGEILGVWEKTKNLTLEFREVLKNPLIAKNLQEVAERYAAYINKQAPGAFEAMRQMMAQMDAARG